MKDTEIELEQGLQPLDIICGRQKLSADHLGNRRFHAMITLSFNRFYHTRWHNKKKPVKTLLVTNIMNNLLSEGARFVKRDPSTNKWLEIKNKRVIGDKICHSLRDLFPRNIDIVRAQEFMKDNGFQYNDEDVFVDHHDNDKSEDGVYDKNNDECHHSHAHQSCDGHMYQTSKEHVPMITSNNCNTLKYYMEQEEIHSLPLNLKNFWEVGIVYDTSKEMSKGQQDFALSGVEQDDNESDSFMAKIDALPHLPDSHEDCESSEAKEWCKTLHLCSNLCNNLLSPLCE